ncbi:hypothetical protein MBLNU230_g2001t1 [Neophaeotheca triangularis]
METAYLRIHREGLLNLPRYHRSQRNSRNASRDASPNPASSRPASPLQPVEGKAETPAQSAQKAGQVKEALGGLIGKGEVELVEGKKEGANEVVAK